MYYFFALVGVVVLVALAFFFFGGRGVGFARHHNEVHEELHQDRMPTLEYAVPAGQDPTVVLAALQREGFTATTDPTHPHQTSLIACPEGVDRHRARVRAVIESAGVTTPEDGAAVSSGVRFRDEA